MKKLQFSQKRVKKNIRDRFNKVKTKLKSKSSLRRRFSISATGKYMSTQAGLRHGMVKRSKRSLRRKGMKVMCAPAAKMVKKFVSYRKYLK